MFDGSAVGSPFERPCEDEGSSLAAGTSAEVGDDILTFDGGGQESVNGDLFEEEMSGVYATPGCEWQTQMRRAIRGHELIDEACELRNRLIVIAIEEIEKQLMTVEDFDEWLPLAFESVDLELEDAFQSAFELR